MACTTNFNLDKVRVDPYDPEAIRATMEGLNRVVDTLYQLMNGGQPVLIHDPGAVDDGRMVLDAADNVIMRVPDVFFNNIGINIGGPTTNINYGSPTVGIVQSTSTGGPQITIYGDTYNVTKVEVKVGDIYGDNTTGDTTTVYVIDDSETTNLVAGDTLTFQLVPGAGLGGETINIAGSYLNMPAIIAAVLAAHVHPYGDQATLVDGFTSTRGSWSIGDGELEIETGIQQADGGDHYHTFTMTAGEAWAPVDSGVGQAP